MATATIDPLTDVTADWDTTFPAAPTTHFSKVDEGTSAPDDADYNETTTIDDVDEYTLEDSPPNTSEVTQIDVNFRVRITDASGTASVDLDLFHSAGTPVTGNPKVVTLTDTGGSGTLTTVVKSWTGLTLTKAQADSLQIRQTFRETGS